MSTMRGGYDTDREIAAAEVLVYPDCWLDTGDGKDVCELCGSLGWEEYCERRKVQVGIGVASDTFRT